MIPDDYFLLAYLFTSNG